MNSLQQAADYYLSQLRAGDFESAFHGLIDLDPAIVYPLIAACHAETSPAIRSNLLCVICEFRTPLALPLLGESIRDRRDDGWKGALDGLVTLASPESATLLESVLRDETAFPSPDSEYVDWVQEAIGQIQVAITSKSSMA
jgi:hypothetical protein